MIVLYLFLGWIFMFFKITLSTGKMSNSKACLWFILWPVMLFIEGYPEGANK